MLIPTVIIPNLPSCSELRWIGGFSMQYVCRDSENSLSQSYQCSMNSSCPSTFEDGFHVGGSKDEGLYIRSKGRVSEHKVQGNWIKLRVGKSDESSRLWWIPSPAELVRDPSKKTVTALLVSDQYIKTTDALSGMLLWAGCLFLERC